MWHGHSNAAPPKHIPKAITHMLDLPEGASADAVLKAMEAKPPIHATPVAALNKRGMGQLLDTQT